MKLNLLPSIPTRFCPSNEVLAVLNGREWITTFSGGKDSTSLVTYIEWLRRIGLVKARIKPRAEREHDRELGGEA